MMKEENTNGGLLLWVNQFLKSRSSFWLADSTVNIVLISDCDQLLISLSLHEMFL